MRTYVVVVGAAFAGFDHGSDFPGDVRLQFQCVLQGVHR